MQRNEHRLEPRGLADLLLACAIVDDGILLQTDGSLMAAWSYRGPDMMSASAAEMDSLSARLNSALRLGTGWMCSAIPGAHPGLVLGTQIPAHEGIHLEGVISAENHLVHRELRH